MERLAEQRAERPARHDDRPLGAERPTGPDGNGGGQRLEYGDPGGHAALPDQDRLERLRDAVTADSLEAVPRHESDDEAPDDGDQQRPETQVVASGRDEAAVDRVVIEQVGEEPDEPQQRHGEEGAIRADHLGQRDQSKATTVGVDVAEFY